MSPAEAKARLIAALARHDRPRVNEIPDLFATERDAEPGDGYERLIAELMAQWAGNEPGSPEFNRFVAACRQADAEEAAQSFPDPWASSRWWRARVAELLGAPSFKSMFPPGESRINFWGDDHPNERPCVPSTYKPPAPPAEM